MEIPSASTAQVANPSNTRQSLATSSNEVKELTQVSPSTARSERVQTDSDSSIPAVDNSQANRSANNEPEPEVTTPQETLVNRVDSQIQQANIEQQIAQARESQAQSSERVDSNEEPQAVVREVQPLETSVQDGNDIQDEISAIS